MAAAVDVHDVCNMQYTSGTTGFPKGVMLTHYNVVNNGKCIGDRMDLSTADRMMIQVPMFHCFGMVLAMTAVHDARRDACCPLPVFLARSRRWRASTSEHITCFHGVPTMFIAMLRASGLCKDRFLLYAHRHHGGLAPAPIIRDAATWSNKMHMTRDHHRLRSDRGLARLHHVSFTDDPLEVRVDTVGSALARRSNAASSTRRRARSCPTGENGEFVARGYNIMKGYYKMPEATAAAIDARRLAAHGRPRLPTPEGQLTASPAA